MFRTLVKKSKENKGFSLIELIIVIAIIAILALILVPRLGGFTGQAKDAADKAAIKTIETAMTALLASGKIGGNGTITIANATDNDDSTVTYSEDVSGDEDDLVALIGTKIRSQTGVGFEIDLDADGSFVVTVDKEDDTTT